MRCGAGAGENAQSLYPTNRCQHSLPTFALHSRLPAGQQRGGVESLKDIQERLASVRPAVAELARLEFQAQESFFKLKRKWVAAA